MRKSIFTIIILALFCQVVCLSACKKSGACDVNKPLEDLPWLKTRVSEITLLINQSKTAQDVSIYQCVYGNNEIGFLIEEGNASPFYNCNGDVLCVMGGFAGATCYELNIVSKKLIWKKKKR